MPHTKHAGACGHYDGGDLCGALSERRYLIGHRCESHTPAKLAGRPETPPPAPLPPTEAPTSSDRYGRATTDPLGREGPGWTKGRNGLPVKTRETND
jgi:hypothetical protein